ncbi:RHS repeat-associated core domain-containing protein [Pseudomonas sp. O230]|uniref:RHS repeat-associated core domain-containing protein n=1 Tax=Pseudomonas sp. O230 TaxID=3159450 RepID=UPI00387B57BD
MTHANTPAIAVIDSRGLGVRAVAYHRRDYCAAESCITQQVHNVVGRAVLSRDPRLFLLHQAGQSAANQISVFSLSGTLLLSENSDAGWRLGLPGEDGQSVEGWDQKLSHNRVHYDGQRRPIASFEHAHGDAEHCIARFSYAAASADESLNRRGQLIRQDDTAGTLQYITFGLGGTPLEHSRTFVEDPQWSVDWPATESECDGYLEAEPLITRLHCNAVGEPIRQTDAKGNVQRFIQTRAAELKAVHLTLAGQPQEKTLVSEIQYNAFGQVKRQRAGNGVISCATFRPEDGRLEHLKTYVSNHSGLQDLTYEYDAVGNITGLSDTAAPTRFHRNQRIDPTHRYRYDSLYRLIAASGRQLRNAASGPQLPAFQSASDPGQLENYTRIYTYDVAGNLELMQHLADSGNRTERTAIAASSNRSLPERTDGKLPNDNDIAAGYDVNGNRMTLQPGQDLLWNLRNQLRQVDRVVREDEPDDTEIYLYDGSGQRLRKIRQTYTGTLTRTHETRYLPDLDIRTSADEILHVITIKAGRGTLQVLHWEQKPASGIPQDQHRYSFTDHLNSSTVELDEEARLITSERYYPYGGTCWWAWRNTLEASYKTIRYSGQERDATGLYYYGFRYYVPWCQRWLSADPLGTADGLNLFAMVHGNPIGHVDLQGLITAGEVFSAASASIGRDGLSALAGGLIRYGAAQGLMQLATNTSDDPDAQTVDATANLALTVAGTGVGALVGGSMGMGAGSNIVSRYSNSRTAQRIGAGIGAFLGAATGAAAPIHAYLSNPEALNVVALSIVTSVPGNLTRETGQRISPELGPRVTLAPSGLAMALRTPVYGALLFAGGTSRAEMPAWAGVLISAGFEGLDGASITAINSLLGGTFVSGTNEFSMPRFWEVMYGWFTRTAGSGLTASLTFLSSPLTSAIANPNVQMGTMATMATPTVARTYLGQHVQRGTAMLFRFDDSDFRLDRFSPPNREWATSAPQSYHPELPTMGDLPMTLTRRGSAHA